MTLLGKQIQLKGISQKGKNRIRENGDRWTVLAETDRVLFSPNEQGPWLYISPKGFEKNDGAARWIRATEDTDFFVIAVDD